MSRNLTIVIPAYEPDDNLIILIDKLNSFFNDFNIIVVNDGSLHHDDIFESVKKKDNVTLLTHEVNRGKGEALKTAFRYIKNQNLKTVIVTADSDGQHKPEDIKKVYDYYKKNSCKILLGSRKFDNNVPFKSSFGNNVSKALLRLCLNDHLNDNQTGLRAFDYTLLDFMINVKGSRFEYEMNMLSEAIRSYIPIDEIAIETIYINNNKGSHFRPIRDFSKISLCIMKYLWPSIISMLVNLAVFIPLVIVYKNSLDINKLICFSLLASAADVLVNVLINLIGICYGNKRIFKSRSRWIKYMIKGILNIGISLGLLLLFNLGFHNYIVIRILTCVILIIIFALFNYFVLKKSKLNEE